MMTSMDDGALDRWVDAGLIDAAQRDAIAWFERDREASRPRAVSALVEVLIYLGVAAALGAVFASMSRVWDDAGAGMRTTVLAVAAVTSGAAGFLVREGRGAQARAAAMLHLVSVGFAAGAAAVLADGAELDDGLGGGTHVLVIGIAATVTALIHHAVRRGAMQLVLVGASLATLGIGIATALTRPSGAHLTAALVAAGAAIAAARAARIAEPASTALWLTPALLLFGFHLAAWTDGGGWAQALGIIGSVVVLGASIPARSSGLLVVGSAGLFSFVPAVIIDRLADSLGAPAALFACAVVLIGAGIAIARVRTEVSAS